VKTVKQITLLLLLLQIMGLCIICPVGGHLGIHPQKLQLSVHNFCLLPTTLTEGSFPVFYPLDSIQMHNLIKDYIWQQKCA
jgi:hypothetical protein